MTIETDLALLKHEVVSVFEIFSRLDVTISKFNDLFSNVNKLLAVHEERMSTQEKKITQIEQEVEQNRMNIGEEIKTLNTRVTDVTKEIGVNLQETERRITTLLVDMKKELLEIVFNDRSEQKDRHKALEQRISSLEKWRWFLMGGALVMGFFANKIISVVSFATK